MGCWWVWTFPCLLMLFISADHQQIYMRVTSNWKTVSQTNLFEVSRSCSSTTHVVGRCLWCSVTTADHHTNTQKGSSHPADWISVLTSMFVSLSSSWSSFQWVQKRKCQLSPLTLSCKKIILYLFWFAGRLMSTLMVSVSSVTTFVLSGFWSVHPCSLWRGILGSKSLGGSRSRLPGLSLSHCWSLSSSAQSGSSLTASS